MDLHKRTQAPKTSTGAKFTVTRSRSSSVMNRSSSNGTAGSGQAARVARSTRAAARINGKGGAASAPLPAPKSTTSKSNTAKKSKRNSVFKKLDKLAEPKVHKLNKKANEGNSRNPDNCGVSVAVTSDTGNGDRDAVTVTLPSQYSSPVGRSSAILPINSSSPGLQVLSDVASKLLYNSTIEHQLNLPSSNPCHSSANTINGLSQSTYSEKSNHCSESSQRLPSTNVNSFKNLTSATKCQNSDGEIHQSACLNSPQFVARPQMIKLSNGVSIHLNPSKLDVIDEKSVIKCGSQLKSVSTLAADVKSEPASIDTKPVIADQFRSSQCISTKSDVDQHCQMLLMCPVCNEQQFCSVQQLNTHVVHCYQVRQSEIVLLPLASNGPSLFITKVNC